MSYDRTGRTFADHLTIRTDVAGSRNAKRYFDVLELLAAGIDVHTTLNVQHIESLSTTAAKITWAPVGETVPDRLLDLADEVEVVDLSAGDLLRRIEEGELGASVHGRPRAHLVLGRKPTALRELALRFAKRRPARRIPVPFDGSLSAVRAVRHVVALARAGHQSEVFILNVQAVASDADPESAERTILEQANELLAKQTIARTTCVLTGRLAEVIVAAVRRYDIDLIVMGSRGLGSIASVLLGSVASNVVQQSAVPVTLVK